MSNMGKIMAKKWTSFERLGTLHLLMRVHCHVCGRRDRLGDRKGQGHSGGWALAKPSMKREFLGSLCMDENAARHDGIILSFSHF